MTKEEFEECFAILENEFGKQSEKIKEVCYYLYNIYEVEELKEAIEHYLKKIIYKIAKKYKIRKEIPYSKKIVEAYSKGELLHLK